MSLFPDPQRVRLDNLSEIAEATDRLLALAQTSIDIFEANLSEIEWGSKQRVEHLRRFLLASRSNRLRIILQDVDVVPARKPRLMELLRLCSDRMEIRETGADAERLSDTFVLVDRQHYLHRFHADHARAEFGIAQPEPAQDLMLRFDELWQTSEPGVAPTALGL
jgi:hypothetical protein